MVQSVPLPTALADQSPEWWDRVAEKVWIYREINIPILVWEERFLKFGNTLDKKMYLRCTIFNYTPLHYTYYTAQYTTLCSIHTTMHTLLTTLQTILYCALCYTAQLFTLNTMVTTRHYKDFFYSTVQYSTVPYRTVQFSIVQWLVKW